jgi:hypothetical protein
LRKTPITAEDVAGKPRYRDAANFAMLPDMDRRESIGVSTERTNKRARDDNLKHTIFYRYAETKLPLRQPIGHPRDRK